MIFLCPKCEAKTATPSAVTVESVECGNCGKILTAEANQVYPENRVSKPEVNKESKKSSWWSRLFGEKS